MVKTMWTSSVGIVNVITAATLLSTLQSLSASFWICLHYFETEQGGAEQGSWEKQK